MFIEELGKEAGQLRQERNVNGQTKNVALLAELAKYLRSRLSINILFRRNWLSVGLAILFLLTGQICATQLPRSIPAKVDISTKRLSQMNQVIEEAIAKHQLPGAVVLVARKGRVVWREAYGSRAVEPQREVMTTDTIFDLASLTKVVATATSIMILVERGRVR